MINRIKRPILWGLLGIFLNIFIFSANAVVWTIAIDPGHGGKDPGAIGRQLHINEKDVTLSIARELKTLLDQDPNFRAVLTRNGDYFISVPERSEIARHNKANYLVSIHADSSISPSLRGASVWVLSNSRANNEMGRWLEDNEKQSELLGGAGDVLAAHNEKYLNQTVLDLQFGHSQRVGYELGNIVLRRFASIATLSHSKPQHASLGVLRSPDIPSILVETGFLSNTEEEQKLSTLNYRKKIARIIYQGLLDYRKRHPNAGNHKSANKASSTAQKENTENRENQTQIQDSGIRHLVKPGDMLSKLAQRYSVKAEEIIQLNKLKRRDLLIGQTLKIPLSGKQSNVDGVKKQPNKQPIEKQISIAKDKKTVANKDNKKANSSTDDKRVEQIPTFHIVEKNQTLYAISRLYNVPVSQLSKLNNLKDNKVMTGQKIRLHQ